MHVETYGRGRRVIVAYHGWAGTHRDFVAVGRRLGPDWRLVAPDLPGYGASPPLDRLSESELATVLVDHLQTIGEPVTLTGYCSGAVVALLVAERARAQVERLVLIDPFAYMPFYFRIFTWGEFGRRAYRTTFAGETGRRITNWVLRRRGGPERDFLDAFRTVPHGTVLAYLHLLAGVGSAERFRGLGLPVALCHGDRTFQAVRRSVRVLRHLWPHARVYAIPHAGHLMMVDAADQIARILTETL